MKELTGKRVDTTLDADIYKAAKEYADKHCNGNMRRLLRGAVSNLLTHKKSRSG